MEDYKLILTTIPDELYNRFMGLWKIPQRADYHPEGNTLKHSIVVMKRATRLYPADVDLQLAAMFHDIGKDVTFKYHETTGMPTAYGHEKISANIVKDYKYFIEKKCFANSEKIEWIVRNHMRVKKINEMSEKKRNELTSHIFYNDLLKFSAIDYGGYI